MLEFLRYEERYSLKCGTNLQFISKIRKSIRQKIDQNLQIISKSHVQSIFYRKL